MKMSPEQIANIINQKMKEAEAAYNEKAKHTISE